MSRGVGCALGIWFDKAVDGKRQIVSGERLLQRRRRHRPAPAAAAGKRTADVTETVTHASTARERLDRQQRLVGENPSRVLARQAVGVLFTGDVGNPRARGGERAAVGVIV